MTFNGGAGGITEFGAAWTSGDGGRRDMPRSLSAALVLVHALFAVTVVGGLGLLLTAASVDAVDGGLLARMAYAAAPGALGWWLARRTWQGGTRIWGGLIAVQIWLIVGSISNIAEGSAKGMSQLLVPVLILCFLTRPDSRAWYRIPESDRQEGRPFSLARMIRWRQDEGQTAVEYAGLIAVVAAIITALVVSGLGTQILTGIQSQVCRVTGMACPAPSNAGSDRTNPGADGPSVDAARDEEQNDEPSSEDATADGEGGDDEGGDGDEGCLSGVSAFFGCAGDQLGQVGEGLFVDGIGGDLAGIWDTVTNPVETWNGLMDYGRSLGEEWWNNTADAREMWGDGDYFDAILDWGGASLGTGGTVLFDSFIGDDVVDQWNNGNQTQAVSTVLWNIGSMVIPGYNILKVAEKAGTLGRLSRVVDNAAEAAQDARRAAEAGDAEAARRAAREADEAADEAEREARASGCTIAAPARRIPYDGTADSSDGTDHPHGLTGSAGTGTTVLASAPSTARQVFVAENGCDEEAREQAEEARRQADEAERAADGVDLADSRDAVREALEEANVPYSRNRLDAFTDRAVDAPDPDSKEIGTDAAIEALDALERLVRTENISANARSSLTRRILEARNTDQLNQARAELNAVQRAAEAAAPGTTVHSGVGGRTVGLGDGESVDLSGIHDADVLYRGTDGRTHVVEVKNTGNATTKADFERQVQDLATWRNADGTGRGARIEIETTFKWTNIFNGYKSGKRDGVRYQPQGTPAQTLAQYDVPVRIAGQDISPDQLERMQREINARSAAGTMEWSRMSTPTEAMEYLGVE